MVASQPTLLVTLPLNHLVTTRFLSLMYKEITVRGSISYFRNRINLYVENEQNFNHENFKRNGRTVLSKSGLHGSKLYKCV